MRRRTFVKATAMTIATTSIPVKAGAGSMAAKPGKMKSITIADTGCGFEREAIVRPFGFKGSATGRSWQSLVMVRSTSGKYGVAPYTQGSLWSDAELFLRHGEAGTHALMFSMTVYALNWLKGRTFTDPVALNAELFKELYEYGKKITNKPNLRETFALNAMVGIDNAIWILFVRENGIENFDDIIPAAYKPALAQHHPKAAVIPLFSYSVPVSEIREAVDSGMFFMKIKIGQPGTQAEMLQKDMDRISELHKILGNCRTPYTKDGRLPYYFDANGRYENKESLLKLLDHTRKIGAFDQIAVIEEPFDEELDIDVHDIPVRLAADESAHTQYSTVERIDMGYKAIAVKAIAKTLSMTMKIAKAAHDRNIPCFCADLTVNPVALEWNKCVAARLGSFPGLEGLGLVETNGHQNFQNWDKLRSYHPYPEAEWTKIKKGVFELDSDYYAKSGGVFAPLPYYESLFPALRNA